MTTMEMSQLRDAKVASRIIRAHLANLYACSDPSQIILCPAQLIGLSLVLHALRFRSILITDEEYYTPDHFPGMEIFVCHPEKVADVARRRHPDAVFMSIVTWKGRILPVRREFHRIRALGGARPMLICDYAHAGAVGFPRFQDQQADIIFGDLHKWVLPRDLTAQIAFLRATTRKLRVAMNQIFSGYYLAGSLSVARAARWTSPQDLVSAALWLQKANPTRRTLRREYKRNLALARDISADLGLAPPATNCIIWLSGRVTEQQARQLERFRESGHVEIWRTAGGWRILCSSR